MSLPTPRSSVQSPSDPDRGAQLLEAVQQRDVTETARLVRQWVHRQGVDSLNQFVQFTIPLQEGPEGCGWLDQQLNRPPLPTVDAAVAVPFANAKSQVSEDRQDGVKDSSHEPALDGREHTDLQQVTEAPKRNETEEWIEPAETVETTAAASPCFTNTDDFEASITSRCGAAPMSIEAIDPWIPRNLSSSSDRLELSRPETASVETNRLSLSSTDEGHSVSPSTSWSPGHHARGWRSLARVRSRLKGWVDDTIEALREPVSDNPLNDTAIPDDLTSGGQPPGFDLQPLASATLQNQVSSADPHQESLLTQDSGSGLLRVEATASVGSPAPLQPAPAPTDLSDLRSWLPDEEADKNLLEAC